MHISQISCPWCGAKNICLDLVYLEAGVDYRRCKECTAIFADDKHQFHDYKKYDYTSVGSGKNINGSNEELEVGFDRAAQAQYLLARYESALTLSQTEPESLLDVGCGPGDFLAAVGQSGSNILLSGLDPSTVNVTAAAKYSGIRVRQAYWEDEIETTYDAITMFGNLMLHNNPRISLQLAFERLNPGGLLFADFKNPGSFTRIFLRKMGFVLTKLPGMRLVYKQAFHGMPWGVPQKLAHKTMREIGFDVIAIRQLSGRNAALSRSRSAALNASAAIDRLFRAQPWIEIVAKKPTA